MDNEIDSLLLQQFSSMATQDRDVLIAQFKSLLGNEALNDNSCEFFLDMNNWNLQDAICSYFEFQEQTPIIHLPRMNVVTDGMDDGLSQVPIMSAPNVAFRKIWHIANSGDQVWPAGCCLRFFSGSQFTLSDHIMIESLSPGVSIHVSFDGMSPAQNGLYKAQWRMSTLSGTFFGETLWVVVQVSDNTTTQCMIDDTCVLDSTSDMSPGMTTIPLKSAQANQLPGSEQKGDGMDIS